MGVTSGPFLAPKFLFEETPVITLMITLGGGAPFPEWTCYRRSFTKARGTGQQLARKEAHVQDAEVVVSQAHPLTRCVIWPLRALVSSSAK